MTGDLTDDQKTIGWLARQTDSEYDRSRQEVAREMGIRVSTLDQLVERERKTFNLETAPALFPHWDVEPWESSVDARALLSEIIARIKRHVAINPDAAVAVALFVMMTWVHERAATHSPILLVTSPEANSGKSTLLGVVSFMVRRSLPTVGITAPALYRSIAKWQPTIIVDEGDTAFVDNEDLRAVVNSGWTRGLGVVRCDSETNEPQSFSTFCPKAIGLKGKELPDTTLSRTIIVEMQRKLATETVDDFLHLDDHEFAALRSRLLRWADDNAIPLAKAQPMMPEGFINRAAANWRLLLAIADIARYGEEARRAATMVAGIVETNSVTIELIRDIVPSFGAADVMPSKALVDKLNADPEGRWCEWKGPGKPLTPRQLAGLLKGFGIIPMTVHPVGQPDAKGYRRADFEHLWERYVLSDPSKRPKSDEVGVSADLSSVRGDASGRIESGKLSYGNGHLDAWTDRRSENGGDSTIGRPKTSVPDNLDIPEFLRRDPPPDTLLTADDVDFLASGKFR
jgi:hypothetical protein